MKLEKGDGIVFLGKNWEDVKELEYKSIYKLTDHHRMNIRGTMGLGEIPWGLWHQTALENSYVFAVGLYSWDGSPPLIMPPCNVGYKVLVVQDKGVTLWIGRGVDVTHDYTGLDDYLKTLKAPANWEEELTTKEYFDWKLGGIKPERFCQG